MVLRSNWEVTLLVVIIRSLWSAWTKLAKILDLIFFKFLSILAMCLLDKDMNFEMFAKPIKTMICFLEGLLVVILILGFIFPESLIVLCIYLIFWRKIREIFFKFQNLLDVKSWGLRIWISTLILRVIFRVFVFFLKFFKFF